MGKVGQKCQQPSDPLGNHLSILFPTPSHGIPLCPRGGWEMPLSSPTQGSSACFGIWTLACSLRFGDLNHQCILMLCSGHSGKGNSCVAMERVLGSLRNGQQAFPPCCAHTLGPVTSHRDPGRGGFFLPSPSTGAALQPALATRMQPRVPALCGPMSKTERAGG